MAAQQLRAFADEEFVRARGITTAQAAALLVVTADPGCSQRVVARELDQRESAITTMAARLEKAGLIERRASSTDARVRELWPTEAGIAAIADLQRNALTVVNEVIEAAIGPERVDDFTEALHRVQCALRNRTSDEQSP